MVDAEVICAAVREIILKRFVVRLPCSENDRSGAEIATCSKHFGKIGILLGRLRFRDGGIH